MQLKITVGDLVLVTLHDNPTTRDFIELLPLLVKLDDYAGTEKVFYPSKKLFTQNAPSSPESDYAHGVEGLTSMSFI